MATSAWSFLLEAVEGGKLIKYSFLVQANISHFNLGYVKNFKISLPDPATRERIVVQIERERALVKANQELIEIFEQKIKERIAKAWRRESSQSLAVSKTPNQNQLDAAIMMAPCCKSQAFAPSTCSIGQLQ